MKIAFSIGWKAALAAVAIVFVVLAASWGGMEYYTGTPEFCGGSCHTMTEQYEAWKSDRHHPSNNPEGIEADCVDCHFLPGGKYGVKAKLVGLRHLAAYLYDRDAPLPIRPVIKDGSCLQSGCHAATEFADKELKFTEKARFTHKVHLGDKALDGQILTCDTCHFKVTAEKHFEVPKDICFLCHLKLEKPTLEKVALGGKAFRQISFENRPTIDFNKGVSRCDICHVVPTKSLQSQLKEDDVLTKPITHQSMQEAGVACEGCHFEVVKGAGEIETGNVVSNGCLTCHNRSPKLLAKAHDRDLMHDKHVAAHKADCFDCHTVIEHKHRTDHLDFVRDDCRLCHQDQHRYQKLLLAGAPVGDGIPVTPHLMFEVNTNCMGCHLQKTVQRGHAVRSASGETCAACHTSEHRKMLDDWAAFVDREVEAVEEIEEEALQAMADAAGKLDGDALKQAEAMIAKGQEFLNIVRIGNGVHNKKYSIMLLDEAFVAFEESLDLMASGG